MPANPNTINNALDSLTSVNKIGFTEFTSGLIDGVFNTIVVSSIKQMEAYASLVSSVSISLSEFIADALGPNNENAINIIKNDFGLVIPTTANATVSLSEAQFELVTTTLTDILISGKAITDTTNLVPSTTTPKTFAITPVKLQGFVVEFVKRQADTKYNMLRTLLQLGMQKVVVDKGHIRTKLTFSIDASLRENSQSSDSSRNNSSTSIGIGGGIGGLIGKGVGVLGGGITSSKNSISVNVVNERSSAATNLSADIIGEVLIQFRTDSFPAASF